MTSSEATQWKLMLHSFVISLAILWLLAKQIGTFNGFIRFFLAFSVFIVITGLSIISNYSGFFEESFISVIFLICSGLILFFSMIAASIMCKGLYLPKRFMLWLGLFTLIGGIFVACVFLGGVVLTNSSALSGTDISKAILYIISVGSIFGVCIYVLNLPFMILPFGDPFFRERFCTCLRLKPVSAASKQANIDSLNEENLGKEMPEKCDSL